MSPSYPQRMPATAPIAGIGDWAALWQCDSRTLFLFSPLNDGDGMEPSVTVDLIRALRWFDAVDNAPITLIINSPGGDIAAGMALIHIMRDLKSPVHTVVAGMAASMGAVVAIAGTKRYAYPAARWLLHRGKSGASGDADDLAIAAKELKVVDGYVDFLVTNLTKIPSTHLKKLQRKDRWFGIEDALKWGIVDEIITPHQGPENWLPDKAFLKTIHEEEEESQASFSPSEGQKP